MAERSGGWPTALSAFVPPRCVCALPQLHCAAPCGRYADAIKEWRVVASAGLSSAIVVPIAPGFTAEQVDALGIEIARLVAVLRGELQ